MDGKLLVAFALLVASVSICPRVEAVSPSAGTATFITLGTRGRSIVARERSELANALWVGSAVYLFNVGDGVQRQMTLARLPLENVRAIFISHHHIDHNGGLAPLLVTRWVLGARKPLPVLGPPGTVVVMVGGIFQAYRATEFAPAAIGSRETPLASTAVPKDLPFKLEQPERSS